MPISLIDIASMANTVTLTDAHGSDTFQAQFSLFTDNTRSGPTTKRRVIEVAPETTIPTRYTVYEALSGNRWILADTPSYDYYKSQIIRVKYPALLVKGSATQIRTIAQVLADSGGVTDAYVDISYVRRDYAPEQSNFEAGYDMLYSPYYTVETGNVIVHEGVYYFARQEGRLDDVGVRAVELLRLEDPVTTMDIYHEDPDSYDSATNAYDTTPYLNTSVFVITKFFDFLIEALGGPQLEDGDLSIYFLKSVVPVISPGDLVGDYRVIAVTDQTSCWQAHCRKA